MSFGKNLQFLRNMHNKMTQEDLAEILGVSRQTISKWELDSVYPEMDKLLQLCQYFSCSMDSLIREDMNVCDNAYSDISIEVVPSMEYTRYVTISHDPETDSIRKMKELAKSFGINEPEIIGWDFPLVTQEQINVFHMHGYVAAWVLPKDFKEKDKVPGVVSQDNQKYAKITIKEPSKAPWQLIPNAYKMITSYMTINKLEHTKNKEIAYCYEKEYIKNGIEYMDVCIAIEE